MSSRRSAAAYLLVPILVGTSLAFGLALARYKVEAPHIVLLPAIVVSGLIGGVGCGLLAMALAMVGAWFFFIPPVWSFDLPGVEDAVALLLYLAVAALVCAPVWHQQLVLERVMRSWRDLWGFTALLEQGTDRTSSAASIRTNKASAAQAD